MKWEVGNIVQPPIRCPLPVPSIPLVLLSSLIVHCSHSSSHSSISLWACIIVVRSVPFSRLVFLRKTDGSQKKLGFVSTRYST